MRRTTFPLLAALSLLVPAFSLAQRRPVYGGTLRVEVRARSAAEDSLEWSSRVYETLVRLDDAGRPVPHLAVSWSHDEQRGLWVFQPRHGVQLHDGSIWTPIAGSLVFPDKQPLPGLLLELARQGNAIKVPQTEGPPLGTGPFRLEQLDPGRTVVLAAHDGYWNGRPFLDRVEILYGRALRDQAVDFELDKADVIEIAPAEVRRLRRSEVSIGRPSLLIALAASHPVRGLSAAIDRSSLHAVLLQRQGEPTGSLLPQWLSGIAFLFPVIRDMDAARAAGAGALPWTIQYDTHEPLLRAIAERVILNASEAGLTLRPAAGNNADLRLVVLPISSSDPGAALADIAAAVNLPVPAGDTYSSERALLDTQRIVPLLHVPVLHRVNPRVHGWRPTSPWPLEEIWIDGAVTRP